MPWTETDFPNAMKNLKPKIRSKAIEIANAVLEDTGKEGLSIAVGISKARGMVRTAKTFRRVK